MKKQSYFAGVIVIAGLGVGLMAGCVTPPTGSAPITIFAAPVVTSGSKGACPGAYCAYVNYTLALPTWGWAPASGTPIHTASDGGGRIDTRIQYFGEYGDSNCGITNIALPGSPPSPAYEFTIYFPSNPPTTNYPIVLTGFNTN